MFKLNLENEDILMKISAVKPTTKKDVVVNFIGNLLTMAGGDIADIVHLILSKDALYLEYKGHAAIGYAEETRNVDRILLDDLESFLVTANENKELIEIKSDKKYLLFIRDNSNEDNLALAMSKVINDIK
ncbi:hypothetical protein ABFP60_11320 [Clostridioides difficile]